MAARRSGSRAPSGDSGQSPHSGASSPKFSSGQKIEYYSKSYDEWIPAVIGTVRADGALRLLHDDGSVLKEAGDASLCRAVSGEIVDSAPPPQKQRTPPTSGKPPARGPSPAPKAKPKAKPPVAAGPADGTPRRGASSVRENSQPRSLQKAKSAVDVDERKFFPGDRIKIKDSGREGELLYIGIPSFSSKEVVGMKLDEKRSKAECDGTAPNGERLFRCPVGYGIFLTSDDVELLPPESADIFPQVAAPDVALNMEAAFDGLVGLSAVKQQLTKIRQLVEVQKKRDSFGVFGGKPLHFAFRGSSGTGMSTVAKLVAHLLRDLEVTASGQFIEVSRKDALAGSGDPEKQMGKLWRAASGGTLMLNNVHQFQDRDRSRDSDGVEAAEYLAKQLDAMARKYGGEGVAASPCWPQPVCIILAAPSDVQFPDALQRAALWSVDFPDYSTHELTEILIALVEKRQFSLDKDLTAERLEPHVREASRVAESTGYKNIAMLQHILDEAISRQTNRAWAADTVSLEGLTTLHEADFSDNLCPSRDEAMKAALNKLDRIVGLRGVKAFVQSLYAQLKMEVERREAGIGAPGSAGTLHMIFSGNPGTGKTTVARIVAELLAAMGLIRKGHLVEADRAALVAGFSGQTALKTRQVVDSAMGGVLFIDEAYALVSEDGKDSFGKEALDTLIKLIEDRRSDLVVILAGYPDEMQTLVSTNPGVRSRFPTSVLFEDYSEAELAQIAQGMLEADGFSLSRQGQDALAARLQQVHAGGGRENGNGRAVRNILEGARRRMAVRLQAVPVGAQRSKAELCTLEASDFG